MQNVFQVDASLLGAATGGGSKPKGTAHTLPFIATGDVGGIPAPGPDTNGWGIGVRSEFQSVFEGLHKTVAGDTDALPEDTGKPIDPLAMLEPVFLAFQSGEIDVETLFDGDVGLAEQAKALLSDVADRLANAGPGDLNGQEMMDLVKDLVQASPQTFSALTGQSTAYPTDADRVATPWIAPPISRPLASLANGRGSDDMPGQIPGTVSPPGDVADIAAFASEGRPQNGAAPVEPQIADPRLTGAGDRPRMQQPSDAVADAQRQISAPTTAVKPAQETTSPPLAQDLDRTPNPLKADLEEARNAASRDPMIDLPRNGNAARTTPQPAGPAFTPLAATVITAQTDPSMSGQPAAGAGLDLGGFDASGDLSAREARPVGPMGTPGSLLHVSPSQMSPAQAQQVTRQIAFAIQNTPGRSVDITLNPAELGHVRISLSSVETGLIVSIQANRPETLDLMRRHADLLASDFRDIGYDGTSFSFEQSGGQGAEQDKHTPHSYPDTMTDGRRLSVMNDLSDTPPSPTVLRVGDGGIDIRL